MAEEEGQQQRADVRAVHVGVRHDDDAVIAQLGRIELIADPGAQRGDQRADLVVLQHLVQPRPLDVEDLAAQRQDRLEAPVASLLALSRRPIALDDVELRLGRVALGAVGQLAGQGEALQRALALHQLARLARGLARARGR